MTPGVIFPLFENFGNSVEEKTLFEIYLKNCIVSERVHAILFHLWDRVFKI